LTPSVHSVSVWLEELKAGEESALGKLHARYWPYLVGLARRKLGDSPRRATDEEDVAQQAFWGFYQSLKGGRLPRLTNRHQLLALLTHITACQAANQVKHELGVQKRGGGRVQGESAFGGESASASTPFRGLEQVPDAGLSPQEKVLLDDCYRHYVSALPEQLRGYAELHLGGLTYREIAERLGCTERTVDRKMALVLARWQQLAATGLSREEPPPPK
jgi:DNA-directed RNA polymerase specialized sigma24 family protein